MSSCKSSSLGYSINSKIKASNLISNLEMDRNGSLTQGRNLDRRKQDIESQIKMLQQEKLEKERTYSSLTNDNEKVARDIQRLTRNNLEKEESIRDLKLTIDNQKREVENQKAALTSVSKKKSFLCC